MNGIESFSEKRNMARVQAGLRGGGPFNKLAPVKSMSVVDGYPAEINQMFQHTPVKQGKIIDVWNERRANGA